MAEDLERAADGQSEILSEPESVDSEYFEGWRIIERNLRTTRVNLVHDVGTQDYFTDLIRAHLGTAEDLPIIRKPSESRELPLYDVVSDGSLIASSAFHGPGGFALCLRKSAFFLENHFRLKLQSEMSTMLESSSATEEQIDQMLKTRNDIDVLLRQCRHDSALVDFLKTEEFALLKLRLKNEPSLQQPGVPVLQSEPKTNPHLSSTKLYVIPAARDILGKIGALWKTDWGQKWLDWVSITDISSQEEVEADRHKRHAV